MRGAGRRATICRAAEGNDELFGKDISISRVAGAAAAGRTAQGIEGRATFFRPGLGFEGHALFCFERHDHPIDSRLRAERQLYECVCLIIAIPDTASR